MFKKKVYFKAERYVFSIVDFIEHNTYQCQPIMGLYKKREDPKWVTRLFSVHSQTFPSLFIEFYSFYSSPRARILNEILHSHAETLLQNVMD